MSAHRFPAQIPLTVETGQTVSEDFQRAKCRSITTQEVEA
jgi:hypothetical protein